MFGNEKFFVAVYCKDQFTIGWEVEDSDFLYWMIILTLITYIKFVLSLNDYEINKKCLWFNAKL